MTTTPADTSRLRGGPVWRFGGKGRNAHLLVPHFARASLYVEPFFGAGSVFWKVKPGTYAREAVNDLDRSLVTFFRVLRDRTQELVTACERTPFARDEFIAALEPSADELEEARRVWIRGRQGYAGKAGSPGDWGRSDAATWNPGKAEGKLAELGRYAARLRAVAIDAIDGVDFVDKWGHAGAFVYADPPYLPETRTGEDYEHEMTAADHARLLDALCVAVGRGARCAVSGYPSALYGERLKHWRRVEFDVALFGERAKGSQRRTEVLWTSYPPADALSAPSRQLGLTLAKVAPDDPESDE